MKRSIFVVMAFCAFCALVASPVFASQPLADKIPAGSLVYFGWAGSTPAMDGSRMGQMLNDPAMKELISTINSAVGSQAGDAQADTIKTVLDIANLASKRPIALALVKIGDMNQSKPDYILTLMIDLGKDVEPFEKDLNKLLAGPVKGLKFTEASAGSTKYKKTMTPAGELSFGFAGELFFLTLGSPDAPATVLNLQPAKSLAKDARFIAAMKEVSGENVQASFFVDIKKIKDKVEQFLFKEHSVDPEVMDLVDELKGYPPATAPAKKEKAEKIKKTVPPSTKPADSQSEFTKIADALGMSGVSTLAGCMRIVDRGIYTKVRLTTPAPHRGLLLPLAGEPLEDADIASLPADSIVFAAANISAEQVFNEIHTILGKLNPRAQKQFDKGLAAANKEFGLSIRDDILASLGDTWTISSAPSQGGLLTGTVLSVKVADAEKLTSSLGKITEFFKGEFAQDDEPAEDAEDDFRSHRRRRKPTVRFDTIKEGKTVINYFTVSSKNDPIPVAPAWCIYKGKMLIALWPQVLQSVIDNDGKNPIGKQAEFVKLRKMVSPKASMISYSDPVPILRAVYPLMLAGGTTGLGFLEKAIKLEKRPLWPLPLTRMEKYLGPEISAISSDAKGINFEGYSSGVSIMSVGPMTLGASTAILLPALSRARKLARRTASAATLRSIFSAIMVFDAEFNKPPKNLKVLIKKNLIGYIALVSPATGKCVDIDEGTIFGGNGKPDYVYFVLDNETPGTVMMAYDKPENYKGEGTNVLLKNGVVRWVTVEKFKELLKDAQEHIERSKDAGYDPNEETDTDDEDF